MESIERQIRQLLAHILDVDEAQIVDAATIREDLGADSLDLVQLIVACSQLFAMEIDDDAVSRLQTFGDVTTYIANRTTSALPA
ncbi:MAG TPA: acyl carrier protein [Caldilineaceae bacterium]|nr:acyl carrier protein [Caldilineaceae bacterium]